MATESQIKKSMSRILLNNKEIVDKYLDMQYNICIRNLVREDSDIERGKAQFIEILRSLMKNTN